MKMQYRFVYHTEHTKTHNKSIYFQLLGIYFIYIVIVREVDGNAIQNRTKRKCEKKHVKSKAVDMIGTPERAQFIIHFVRVE